MASKAQARRELAKLGLELEEGAGKQSDGSMHAIIDAVGRKSFGGDCRGHVVYDYTASAAEFWDEVIDEARGLAPTLCDCPHPAGECDFHDYQDED